MEAQPRMSCSKEDEPYDGQVAYNYDIDKFVYYRYGLGAWLVIDDGAKTLVDNINHLRMRIKILEEEVLKQSGRVVDS